MSALVFDDTVLTPAPWSPTEFTATADMSIDAILQFLDDDLQAATEHERQHWKKLDRPHWEEVFNRRAKKHVLSGTSEIQASFLPSIESVSRLLTASESPTLAAYVWDELLVSILDQHQQNSTSFPAENWRIPPLLQLLVRWHPRGINATGPDAAPRYRAMVQGAAFDRLGAFGRQVEYQLMNLYLQKR